MDEFRDAQPGLAKSGRRLAASASLLAITINVGWSAAAQSQVTGPSPSPSTVFSRRAAGQALAAPSATPSPSSSGSGTGFSRKATGQALSNGTTPPAVQPTPVTTFDPFGDAAAAAQVTPVPQATPSPRPTAAPTVAPVPTPVPNNPPQEQAIWPPPTSGLDLGGGIVVAPPPADYGTPGNEPPSGGGPSGGSPDGGSESVLPGDDAGGVTGIDLTPGGGPIATAPTPAPTADPNVVDVRTFGARGDGVADDYEAVLAAVAEINRRGRGKLLFPPGTYRLDRFMTTGPNANGIQHITFRKCKDLVVSGYGAKIEVKGDFYRSADYLAASGVMFSYTRALQPLVFEQCEDFAVEGFELDGNVDQADRDVRIGETPSHGIATRECSNYELRDLNIHHFQTDGIYLGGSATKADRNASVRNVVASHNARQGMSIIQLRGGLVTGCRFEATGLTEGRYAPHDPQAGVDVEPNRDIPTMDVKTGDIAFEDCIFENNQGCQFTAGLGLKTENIRVSRCLFRQGSGLAPINVVLAANGGILEDSTIEADYVDVSRRGEYLRTIIRRNTFWSKGQTLVSKEPSDVLIEDNRFFGTHVMRSDKTFLLLESTGAVFRSNKVYVPAVAYATEGSTFKLLLRNLTESSGNEFQYDAAAKPYYINQARSNVVGDKFLAK